jgi:hypothetical protein
MATAKNTPAPAPAPEPIEPVVTPAEPAIVLPPDLTGGFDLGTPEQQAIYLDGLYALSGRDDPAHPQHSSQENLVSERAQELITLDQMAIVSQAQRLEQLARG